jgi:hypothetical protein
MLASGVKLPLLRFAIDQNNKKMPCYWNSFDLNRSNLMRFKFVFNKVNRGFICALDIDISYMAYRRYFIAPYKYYFLGEAV